VLTRDRICETLRIVAPQYEIDEVYLFGSHARGDANEESDCDFRIVGGNIPSLFELGGLYEDLISSLGCQVDIVLSDSMSRPFHEQIRDEEVLVYAKV